MDPAVLQWGRNFIVAEMSVRLMVGRENMVLQWGRNFIVAEMCCIGLKIVR